MTPKNFVKNFIMFYSEIDKIKLIKSLDSCFLLLKI